MAGFLSDGIGDQLLEGFRGALLLATAAVPAFIVLYVGAPVLVQPQHAYVYENFMSGKI